MDLIFHHGIIKSKTWNSVLFPDSSLPLLFFFPLLQALVELVT